MCQIVNSFFLTPINHEELESLIKEMNTSKSIGPYSIPTNILKISCSVLSKPLVKLINFSFSEGTFPNLLKFANVIPVFKNGDNLDYNNYRPISLISNIGKLIEKIVHKRLYSFLEKNSLLFKQQYGFRNKLSTNHALISPIEYKECVTMVSMHVGFMKTLKRPLTQLIIIYYWTN